MKKKSLFLTIIALAIVSLFVSCKSAPEKIQEACKQKDFEKAHDVFNEEDWTWEGEPGKINAALYLLEKETDYLIDQNEEMAARKIIVLLKDPFILEIANSHESYREKYREKLKSIEKSIFIKAIKMGNDFVLKEFLKEGIDIEECFTYLIENPTEENISLAADRFMKKYKSFSDLHPKNRDYAVNMSEIWKDNDELKLIFNASIKNGYLNIAEKLLDHIKQVQDVDGIGNSEFIMSLDKIYQDELKKKKK